MFLAIVAAPLAVAAEGAWFKRLVLAVAPSFEGVAGVQDDPPASSPVIAGVTVVVVVSCSDEEEEGAAAVPVGLRGGHGRLRIAMAVRRLLGRDGRLNLRRRLRSGQRRRVTRVRRVSRRSGRGLLGGGRRARWRQRPVAGRRPPGPGRRRPDLARPGPGPGRRRQSPLRSHAQRRGRRSCASASVRWPCRRGPRPGWPRRSPRPLRPASKSARALDRGRLGLGRIARRVGGGADGFGGVELGLRRGDGFAGAVGLAGRRGWRCDGQGHGGRCEKRYENRFCGTWCPPADGECCWPSGGFPLAWR